MQVVIDGLLTSYNQYGKGKKLLLFLHGWADSSKTFESLAKDLIKNSKEFQIITLDLPGFGGTQAPSTGWTLSDYSEFVSKFLDKIKQEPTAVLGHSNGGAIAIDAVASEKINCKKLVLIASAGVRDPSLKKSFLRVASVPAKLGIKALPKRKRQEVRQKLYKKIGSDYLIAEGMQDTFKRVVSTDVTKSAAQLNLPTLLIYGQNDDSTPPEFGQRLSNVIAGSTINIIPEAGHFVHQEQVYKVSRMIQDFVK